MTTIQWTDKTCSIGIRGCKPISPGCSRCFASRMARRLIGAGCEGYTPDLVERGVYTGVVRASSWYMNLDMDRLPKRKPTRVFPSMVDPFHVDVPFRHLDRVLDWFRERPHLTLQLLTKRAERMMIYATQHFPRRPEHLRDWPRNVWAGISVEDQERADERIPHLLRVPAAVRFLSVEPMLGPVDLRYVHPWDDFHTDCLDPPGGKAHGVSWVIVGGESGPRARPCNVEWIRDIVRQCRETSTACFVKQLGANPVVELTDRLPGCMDDADMLDAIKHPKGGDPNEWPADLRVREMPG